MENKINVSELLKDCPKGMELDCTMFENVTFVGVDIRREEFPIEIRVGIVTKYLTKYLTKEGCYHRLDFNPSAKCVIFPKGKTTWEGFHRPFKDGDIVANGSVGSAQVFIFKEYIDIKKNHAHCYMMLDNNGAVDFEGGFYYVERFATEEETKKLLDTINAGGLQWNAETKTLETPKPQYPKTYEECCSVLNIPTDECYIDIDVPLDYNRLLSAFTELLICRKAYWKVSGEQMGLGKPWEPDWDKLSTEREFIRIKKGCFTYSSRILVFPTAEMRDAFCENFKDLIEECKELL